MNLAVGQAVTVDFSLKVGQTREQVTVEADAPVVNPTPVDISGLVGSSRCRICRSTGAATTNC